MMLLSVFARPTDWDYGLLAGYGAGIMSGSALAQHLPVSYWAVVGSVLVGLSLIGFGAKKRKEMCRGETA